MQDWLFAAAHRRPDHTFLVTPLERVSFARFDERVRCVTGALRSMGLQGRRVGVRPASNLESVAALFAVPRVPAEVVLINSRLTRGEVSTQLADAGADILLTGTGAGDASDVASVPIDMLDGPSELGVTPDPDRVHSIVFTSGTSGRVKGVRLTWGNLEASAAGSARHLRHGPGDRWLGVLPIYHVGGLQILIRSAREATTIFLEPSFDESRAAALMQEGEVTLASMVPQMITRLLAANPGPYENVRAVLVGGGPLPRGLVAEAASSGLSLLPTYGMTETASGVATARLDDPLERRLRVFPLPGAEIRCDSRGVIQVRGPMVSPGYLGEPDRRSDAWFETGDVGELDGEGGLVVLGRADEVIITGGENVHPAEVEGVLGSHPHVNEVAVVGVDDQVWGQRIVAFYSGDAAPGELERYARYRLAGFKVPKQWVPLQELPRLSIGKVDLTALREMVAGGFRSG